MYRYRLKQTICMTTTRFSGLTLIILEPVVQYLGLGRRIIPVIDSFIAGRHDVKTSKLLIIFGPAEVPRPIWMRSVEFSSPLFTDICTILSC